MTSQAPIQTSGQVITFYSYKGGVGRSMALANVACLLAREHADGPGVLVIDWDLEAPGLHRFFRDRFTRAFGDAENYDLALDLHPGLLELFSHFAEAARAFSSADIAQSEEESYAMMQEINLDQFVIQTDVPSLSLLKAGRFDEEYASRVNTFQWEALYNRSPWLIRAFAERLAERYSYVLIDSRTGVTDTSGICTMLMPEKLIVVFTPNRQSLMGVKDLTERAVEYRQQSDDLRPLVVFPLPSRIEMSEKELRERWRSEEGIGYQPLFENLFRELYHLPHCNLGSYFDEVQIQHMPRYSYGEEIAVLLEPHVDRLSLTHAYQCFTDWLVKQQAPWKSLAGTTSKSLLDEQNKLAEAAFARLTPIEQDLIKRTFPRLVRVASPDEVGGDTGQQINLSELSEEAQALMRELAKARLVVIEQGAASFSATVSIASVSTQIVVGQDSASRGATVRAADESLIRGWQRLQGWLNEDREFLLWRQALRRNLAEWEQHRDRGALLSGVPLHIALEHQRLRPLDLNQAEHGYIKASQQAEREAEREAQATLLKAEESTRLAAESSIQLQRTRRRGAALGIVVLILITVVGGALLLYSWQTRRAQQSLTQAVNLNTQGQTLAAEGKLDDAILKLQEATQLKDDYAEAYVNLGNAWREKGDNAKAITCYTTAIKLDPNNPAVLASRGQLYANQSDFAKAVDDYSQAINRSPNNPDLYIARSSIYRALDRREDAAKDIQKATSLATPTPQPTATASAASVKVYVHYNEADDKPTIQRLVKDLAAKNYKVLGAELRPEKTEGEVRYFNESDRQTAREISGLVNRSLAAAKVPSDIQVIVVKSGRFTAPVGQIEVWLPPLRKASMIQQSPQQSKQYPNQQTPSPAQKPVSKKD